MTILGPLVAPRTSTVTPALSRPDAVTFSPSTTMTTGRVSDSPTPVSTLSISMTSPTATFCCLLPARTTAYTAGSLSLGWRMPGEKTMGARQRTEDQLYWLAGGRVKTSRSGAWSRFRCVVQPSTQPRVSRFDKDHPHYRWVALSNTTLGVLMATINSSIVIISLPAIFRGIVLDPLAPGNVSYLLWMLMGFLLVSAVLVVSLARLGDIYGRVRVYRLGFVVFTGASIILALD